MNVTDKIVMKPINEIIPYDKNPRKNTKTIELLVKIIPEVGFNVPLVLDKNNVIVKGHARYQAALQLGMTELPCVISEADPEAIKADRIADNKIFEFSSWINEELMHEVDMIDLDFDLSDMGLPHLVYDDFPEINDFDAEEFKDEERGGLTEEERRKAYEEFLAQQEKENAEKIQMTTQGALDAAKFKQVNIPRPPRDYRQVICQKCGHVMYVDKNVLYSKDGTVRR